MAANPAFSGVSNALNVAQVSAANTARDGTGTIVTLVTAASSGTLVERIHFHATVTTAAAVLNIWTSSDSGTTWRLVGDVSVAAVTPSTTVQAWAGDYIPPGGKIVLPGSTWRLGVTCTVAQATNCVAFGGDI